jgi:hypothetical protein
MGRTGQGELNRCIMHQVHISICDYIVVDINIYTSSP